MRVFMCCNPTYEGLKAIFTFSRRRRFLSLIAALESKQQVLDGHILQLYFRARESLLQSLATGLVFGLSPTFSHKSGTMYLIFSFKGPVPSQPWHFVVQFHVN